MLADAVDQRHRRTAADALAARAFQDIALRREIAHQRGEIDLALEPGFDDMAVGRRHLDHGGTGQGRHMARYRFLARCLDGGFAAGQAHQHHGNERGSRAGAHGKRSALPPAKKARRRRWRPARRVTGMHRIENGFAQRGRGGEARRGIAQARAQLLARVAQRAALRAIFQMPCDLGAGGGIEFGVEPAVEHLTGAGTIHLRAFRGAAPSSRASRSRPRDMRDITVPIGTFTIALISM